MYIEVICSDNKYSSFTHLSHIIINIIFTSIHPQVHINCWAASYCHTCKRKWVLVTRIRLYVSSLGSSLIFLKKIYYKLNRLLPGFTITPDIIWSIMPYVWSRKVKICFTLINNALCLIWSKIGQNTCMLISRHYVWSRKAKICSFPVKSF